MTQMLLMTVTMTSSALFSFMNHPLAMGLVLLMQTALISMIAGLMAPSFWFSYILFLIFLGGMLVLFIYVASLASNEMFSAPLGLISSLSIGTILVLAIILLTDKQLLIIGLENNEMYPTYSPNNYETENCVNLLKLYNTPTNLITTVLIVYLLITLIAAVKVTNIFKGPLRHAN